MSSFPPPSSAAETRTASSAPGRREIFALVLSPGILEEMGRTLLYEKLSKYHRMTGEEIAAMLESFAGDSVLVLESLPSRRAEILP